MTTISRGIRNHNPGNIDRTSDRWHGIAADQSSDKRFVVFEAPVWGLRALAKVLLSYQRKHGLRTPAAIIGRWAPPSENDTGAYARKIAKALGVGVNDQIDLQRADTLQRILPAIVQHENGQQPYSEALIAEAVRLALA